MPYATKGLVTTSDKSNDKSYISISESQYLKAIEGMMAGMEIQIDGGFKIVAPVKPEEPKAE